MAPRTGRPKVDNPKSFSFSVRLDSETEAKLQEYCLRNEITKGEAVRRGVHLLLEKEKWKSE